MNMKKILEMKAKREDSRLKAMAVLNKAEAEDRFLSEDEQKDIDKYEEEIRAWDESIGRAEKLLAIEPEDRSTEKPEVKPTPAKDNEKRFSSFGEQLMAAYRAAMPGGKVDERLSTRAASGLNETTPSDGGFLVQQDFVTELLKRTYETGILASKVKKIPISTNANGMKINAIDEDSRANGSRWGGVQTFWEGEADEITASKPKFRQMELSLKKLTGLCYATDELLQDAAALEAVIRQAFAEEFGFKIDDAILSGSGEGEPLGILNSGAIVTVAKEASQTDTITVENLIKMWNRLWSRSRANAVWYINQELEPYLYTLKIGDNPCIFRQAVFRRNPTARSSADLSYLSNSAVPQAKSVTSSLRISVSTFSSIRAALSRQAPFTSDSFTMKTCSVSSTGLTANLSGRNREKVL